jgi:hypothetical protein
MFARESLSLHSACLPAHPENLPSPIIPALVWRSHKPNYSRTYAIPREEGYTSFLVRRPIPSRPFPEIEFPALFPFNHLRTLSFSVSHLSRVFSMGCTLFGKRPGVHPLLLPLSPPFHGTPFSRMAALPTFLQFTSRWPRSVTPFTRSLTQKQGGRGYWLAMSGVEGSHQRCSLSAVDCRLLASPSYSPPCPTSPFPLEWKYPFPVITGENQ